MNFIKDALTVVTVTVVTLGTCVAVLNASFPVESRTNNLMNTTQVK